MLTAYRQLGTIERRQAATAELPVASLAALTANINRDPKKGKPFAPVDFCLFREPEVTEGLSAEAAAVALSLRHEGKAPAIVLAAWPQVLAGAKEGTKMPTIRALHSEDGAVWVLAPQWEGQSIRGGLVAVHGRIHGQCLLRDLDRPLATYEVVLPDRPNMGWIEAGLLLKAGET